MKNSGFKMSGYSYPGTSPYQKASPARAGTIGVEEGSGKAGPTRGPGRNAGSPVEMASPLNQMQLIKMGLKSIPKIIKKVKSLFTKSKTAKPKPKTPNTTTLPDGRVIPFDPMRRQIINP